MTERVVVTGARGFVARRLIAELLRRDVHVVAMSRDPAAAPAGAEPARYPTDGAFAPELFAGAAAVVHTAAFLPPHANDPSFAARCFEVNALETLALWRAAAAAKVEHAVYLSSGNAYRYGATPRKEDDPLFPSRHAPWYLTSKVAGEIYANAIGGTSGLRTSVLRLSSVYGPGMKGGMLRTFVRRAILGEGIEVDGGGAWGADLVYVDDVVSGIAEVLARRAAGTFNLGSGERVTSADAARAVLRVTGRAASDLRISGEAVDAIGFAALDVQRARETLGFAPRSLEAGLHAWHETAFE